MIQLTDLEIDKLQVLLGDEVMLATISKVFNKVIEENSPKVKDENNTVLGEKYRAYELSKTIIRQGFTELNNYVRDQEVKEIENRAR